MCIKFKMHSFHQLVSACKPYVTEITRIWYNTPDGPLGFTSSSSVLGWKQGNLGEILCPEFCTNVTRRVLSWTSRHFQKAPKFPFFQDQLHPNQSEATWRFKVKPASDFISSQSIWISFYPLSIFHFSSCASAAPQVLRHQSKRGTFHARWIIAVDL